MPPTTHVNCTSVTSAQIAASANPSVANPTNDEGLDLQMNAGEAEPGFPEELFSKLDAITGVPAQIIRLMGRGDWRCKG